MAQWKALTIGNLCGFKFVNTHIHSKILIFICGEFLHQTAYPILIHLSFIHAWDLTHDKSLVHETCRVDSKKISI